ncbi:MAG: phage head closure protein [Flavobacteriales bacterium]
MAIAAGDLDTLVEFQHLIDNRDPLTNELKQTWVGFDRAWAKIEPIATREFVASGAMGAAMTAKIVVRDHVTVNSTHRVLVLTTGDLYQVQGVVPIPADHKKAVLCSSLGMV